MTDYRTQGLNCESVCGKRISSERRIGRRNGATHRSSSHQIINSLLKFPYKEETPVIPPRRRGESRTPDIGASKMSAFSTGLHLEVRWLLETTVWRAKKRTGSDPHPVRAKTRRNAHEHRGVIMLCHEFWNLTASRVAPYNSVPLEPMLNDNRPNEHSVCRSSSTNRSSAILIIPPFIRQRFTPFE